MKELLRTTDIVRLSFLEGSANAIPRRLAVRDEDFSRAKWVLEESGEQLDAE